MIKKIAKLDLTYAFIPIGLFSVMLILLFKGNANLQLQILIFSAVSYVGLAIFHHHQDKSLTLEIIVEYILIAALIIIVLQGQLI